MKFTFSDTSTLVIPEPFGTSNLWGDLKRSVTILPNGESHTLLTGSKARSIPLTFKQLDRQVVVDMKDNINKFDNPVSITEWSSDSILKCLYLGGFDQRILKRSGWEFTLSFLPQGIYSFDHYNDMLTL